MTARLENFKAFANLHFYSLMSYKRMSCQPNEYLRRPRTENDEERLLTPVYITMNNCALNVMKSSKLWLKSYLFHMEWICDCVSYEKFVVKCQPWQHWCSLLKNLDNQSNVFSLYWIQLLSKKTNKVIFWKSLPLGYHV